MKKLHVSTLTVAVMVALSAAVSAADFNASSALNNKITVDGEKDIAYVSAAIPVDYEAAEGASTGQVYAAWDNDYLYLFMEVTDAHVQDPSTVTSIWSDDAAEFYINLSGEEGSISSIMAAQYTYGPSFTTFAGGGLHRELYMNDVQAAYKYTDAGWNVEVAIPWGDDYTPETDAAFPFCAAINDQADDDISTREYQTFTGPNQGNSWQVADSSWDTMHLTAEEYVEPQPEPEVTPEPEPEVAAEAESVPEVVEAVTVSTPVAVETAPQTFDGGVVAAIAAIVSAAGYTLSKKK